MHVNINVPGSVSVCNDDLGIILLYILSNYWERLDFDFERTLMHHNKYHYIA